MREKEASEETEVERPRVHEETKERDAISGLAQPKTNGAMLDAPSLAHSRVPSCRVEKVVIVEHPIHLERNRRNRGVHAWRHQRTLLGPRTLREHGLCRHPHAAPAQIELQCALPSIKKIFRLFISKLQPGCSY